MAPSPVPGYAGRLLRIDLTGETTMAEPLDEATLRRWVGGTGLGAKYLYEEVPPGVQWSDPENRLIIASGPLGGTRVNGGGTYSVVTKGALTDGATATQANGFFGAYLRFSGFDGILLQGAASGWVYIYVHDGVAELRDASHLLGKATWETEDAIKEELGLAGRKASVACIGPAGEHQVRFASIENDHGHFASHNGVGAVLGSKRVKAIAVSRGTGRMAVANSQRLTQLGRELTEEIKADLLYSNFYKAGTLWLHPVMHVMGALPNKNYTTSVYPEPEKLAEFCADHIRTRFKAKRNQCWACQTHHCGTLTIPEGEDAGTQVDEPEYEGLSSMGSAIGNLSVDASIALANEVDQLGIDTNEAGWLIGFVMECYEKGLLTGQQLDGLEMTWGNVPATRALLGKIARREGFGDVLADGVMRAARFIGGEALNMAIHTMKGATPRSHDHRSSMFGEMFDTSVSSTGTLEGGTMLRNSEWADLGLPAQVDARGPAAAEEIPARNVRTKGIKPFEDSLGTCQFTTNGAVDQLCAMVSAATGWAFRRQEAFDMGERTVNLMKAFDLRHGHGRSEDRPSPRYGAPVLDGPNKGFEPTASWDAMLDNYYRGMGWDEATGKPLPETLKRLDLEMAIADLWG